MAAGVFGSDKVVAGDEMGEVDLGSDAVVHGLDDGARPKGADGGPNHPEAPKGGAFGSGLEGGDFFFDDVEHGGVVGLGGGAAFAAVVELPGESMNVSS